MSMMHAIESWSWRQRELEDLLADDMIQAVMRADHVEPSDIRRLFDATFRQCASSNAPHGRTRRSITRCTTFGYDVYKASACTR